MSNASESGLLIVALLAAMFASSASEPVPLPMSTSHAPILILSDSDFTPANGVVGGSGIAADPYRIEGWEIDATTAHGIEIRDTSSHFVIRDTRVSSSPSTLNYTGILLQTVSHAQLENVTAEDLLHGVWGENVEDIRILRSQVSRTGNYGIFLRYAVDVTVEGSTIRDSGLLNTVPGFYLYDAVGIWSARNVTIADNSFFGNDHNGVDAEFSPNISIHDNTFEGNWGGVSVWEAGNVSVFRNTVSNQSGNGLGFLGVKDITVEDNHVSNVAWGIAFGGILGDPALENERVAVRRNVLTANAVGMGINSIIAPSVTDNLLLGNTNPGLVIEFVEDGVFAANVVAGTLWDGVVMYQVNDTTLRGNNITGSVNRGIWAMENLNPTILENRIAANGFGVSLEASSGALIHHNLFLANSVQAEDDAGATNAWDDGYPSGGNWWSDYGGVDQCSGPLQNVCPDPDGIGDTPYVIDGDSRDRYPLWTPAELPPHASFTVTPASGTIATVFAFDANASWDPNENSSTLEVRWDWEDDATWDTAYSTAKTASRAYATPATYTVRMEVRDSTGRTNETTRSVAVVNTPPVASLSVSPPIGGLATTFTANASASSDVEDPLAALEVRWDWEDDGTWDTPWSTAKTASHVYGAAGARSIRMEVRDTGGLTDSETATVSVVPGPVTALVVGTPNATAGGMFVTSATPLSFSVDDPGATGIRNTMYRLNGDPWINYTAMGPFTLVGEGAHVLEWRSEDFVGNVEPVRNATLTVDDTPPSTTLQIGNPNVTGAQVFVTSATPFILTATDGGTTSVGLQATQYRLDNGAWFPYSVPIVLPAGDGPRTVSFKSTDLLGNAEAEATVAAVLDNAPPTTSIQVGNPSYASGFRYVTSDTSFTLTSLDAGVGVASTDYQVDGGGWMPYTAPFSLGPGEGTRTIMIRSQDSLGNVEPAYASDVVVDDTPPTTVVEIGTPKHEVEELYVTSATLFVLNASDGGAAPVGVERTEYRVRDTGGWSAWRAYAGAFTLLSGEGLRTLEVRSVDRLENEENVVTIAVVLDDAPPETTLNPGGGSRAAGTMFSLAAIDNGSGVLRTEVRIDDGPWAAYEGHFPLGVGEHIVRFRSEDHVSNLEPERVESVRIESEAVQNLKWLLAAVMSVLLAIGGVVAARWNPRHGTRARTWMVRSLPFVLAEAATGVLSALMGWLSIPPIVGLGTAVDLSIVVVGFLVAFFHKRERGGSDTPAVSVAKPGT